MISPKSIPSFTILLPVVSLVSITLFVLFMINNIKLDLISLEKKETLSRYHSQQKERVQKYTSDIISQVSIILESETLEYKAYLQKKIHTILKHLRSAHKHIKTHEKQFLREQIEIFNQNNAPFYIDILKTEELQKKLSKSDYLSYKKEHEILISTKDKTRLGFDYIIPYNNLHLLTFIKKDLFFKSHKENILHTLLQSAQNKDFKLFIHALDSNQTFSNQEKDTYFFKNNIFNDLTMMRALKENNTSALFKKILQKDKTQIISYTIKLPSLHWLISVSLVCNKEDIKKELMQNNKKDYFEKRTEELLLVIIIVSIIILLLSLVVAKIINTLFANFKQTIEEQNNALKNFNIELSEKVRSKTKELQASEERYRTIFERSRDGVLILQDKQVSYCNQSLLKMFKVTKKSSIIKQTIDHFFPDLQHNKEASSKLIYEHLNITSKLGHSHFECSLQKSNQQTFYAEVWFQALELEGKESIYVLFRDIDFQKEALDKIEKQHKELIELNETLEEKVQFEVLKNQEKEQLLVHQSRLAQMGEMISMIAHQWRQPLNAISTSSANMKLLMALDQYDEKSFDKHLTHIDHYIQHLSETINDFRNFFKPDKKEQESTVDDVIIKSLNIIEHSLKANNIKVNLEIPKGITIVSYPHELMQVVLNILKNAEDILLERDVQDKSIHISYTSDEQYHQIHFCDNAGGIPEAIIDQIFDPYFSTKNQKNGTGLGLYMSKVIISEHCKGLLSVQNQKDGACFTVKLPK